MRLGNAISSATTLLRRTLAGARGIDRAAWLHSSVDFRECRPGQIVVGPRTVVDRAVWLNVPLDSSPAGALTIGAGCSIGRNNVISAKNRVEIHDAVVTAPQVLIMDHAHAFEDVSRPILHQGVTEGGIIVVESGCWIGFGAALVCNRGPLRVGGNSVVAANAVVTGDVPPRTIVAGAPARVIRAYDESTGTWRRVQSDADAR